MEALQSISTLHLPRILCLHGGGSNARIFRAQCRNISSRIKSHFRLVFVEGPFTSLAGPCVLSVYAEWGPYKRWLPWASEDSELDTKSTALAIDHAIQFAMDKDDMKGATGDWVALMGFSQGAKVCASLLFRQQVLSTQERHTLTNPSWISRADFQFAVLMAGRGPLLWLDPTSDRREHADLVFTVSEENLATFTSILRLPTVHVHGLQDPNLNLHRLLLHRYCDRGKSRLVEWNGDHRVPFKSRDVDLVVGHIYDLAKQMHIIF